MIMTDSRPNDEWWRHSDNGREDREDPVIIQCLSNRCPLYWGILGPKMWPVEFNIGVNDGE